MNASKAGRLLAGVALAVAAAACGVERKVKGGKVATVIDQDPAGRSFIEAIGIGASDPSLPTETQRMALARDAAVVKAQYEMLSMVKGVEIEGGVTVKQALEADSTLEARLKDVIRGAEIVKSEFTKDGGCVATLRLPKKRLETLMGVKFK